LAAALGVEVREAAALGRNWVMLAESAHAVRGARPDFPAVAALGDMIVLTAPADGLLRATATLPAEWSRRISCRASSCRPGDP